MADLLEEACAHNCLGVFEAFACYYLISSDLLWLISQPPRFFLGKPASPLITPERKGQSKLWPPQVIIRYRSGTVIAT